jgi:hypothetical protein
MTAIIAKNNIVIIADVSSLSRLTAPVLQILQNHNTIRKPATDQIFLITLNGPFNRD